MKRREMITTNNVNYLKNYIEAIEEDYEILKQLGLKGE